MNSTKFITHISKLQDETLKMKLLTDPAVDDIKQKLNLHPRTNLEQNLLNDRHKETRGSRNKEIKTQIIRKLQPSIR